jgi:hypothetical protein
MNLSGACHRLFRRTTKSTQQAGNYGVCRCLVEMSEYRAEGSVSV